jgi:CDP-glucose 4,6-dehydratase
MSREWVRPRIEYMNEPLPEAGSLALDSSLARNALGWRPAWTTGEIVRHTAGWYRDYYQNPKAARAITEAQLDEWRSALRGEGGRETGR